MNENEVKKTVTEEKGAVVDVATGTAKIPHGEGVRVENLNQAKYVLDDTPANRAILAAVLARNGFHREAAELRGEKYEPSVSGSVKNFVTENTNLLKGMATIAIGAATYYLGKKALQFLSRKMGWTLFIGTSDVPLNEATEVTVKPFPAPRRREAPQTPMASA